MTSPLPDKVVILAIGPSAAAIGRRLRMALPGAELHGPRAHPADWDESLRPRWCRTSPRCSPPGRPIVGLCAAGILIRALAPLLADKRRRAAGRRGRRGRLGRGAAARRPSRRQRARPRRSPALTGGRRGDHHRRRSAARPRARRAAARLAHRQPRAGQAGRRGAARRRAGRARRGGRRRRLAARRHGPRGPTAANAPSSSSPTVRCRRRCDALVFHPPVLALGIGCERGCPAEEIAALAQASLAEAGLAPGAVAARRLGRAQGGRAGDPRARRSARRAGAVLSRPRGCSAETAASDASARRRRFARPAAGASPRARRWPRPGRAAALVVAKRKSRARDLRRRPRAGSRSTRRRSAARAAGSRSSASARATPAWRTPEASAALAPPSDIVGYRPLSRSARAARSPARRCMTATLGAGGGARPARPRPRRAKGAAWRWSRRAMPASTAWPRWSSS